MKIIGLILAILLMSGCAPEKVSDTTVGNTRYISISGGGLSYADFVPIIDKVQSEGWTLVSAQGKIFWFVRK